MAQCAVRVRWQKALGELSEAALRAAFGAHGAIDTLRRTASGEALLVFDAPGAAAAAVADAAADDDFEVTYADPTALDGADAAAGNDDDENDRAARGAALGGSVAEYAPYKRPKHDDVVGGVRVPQTPADDALAAHEGYEEQVLQMIRREKPPR